MTERRLWTPQDVSDFLSVPVATLYVWRHRGQGPASLRVGRHLRYREESVRRWVEERERSHNG